MRYKIAGVAEGGMSSREQEGGERLMREVVDEKMDGASTQQEKILEQDGKSRNGRLPSLASLGAQTVHAKTVDLGFVILASDELTKKQGVEHRLGVCSPAVPRVWLGIERFCMLTG